MQFQVVFQQLLLSTSMLLSLSLKTSAIFAADAPKSSRHKFCFYYFMKSSSFKLLDGKWAEWEEQEAENRCDKGQQELQEQTIPRVQHRGNITNQKATLGIDSVFFLIFHLRWG